ncbi:HNH endonuclease family protein [Sinomonas sp. P10A9]|uniref:HNH endonuclease family protein n=1 Tax=Sinomonas puerhi TaxID=3238584 RepID=A0AB39L1L1_9MICC
MDPVYQRESGVWSKDRKQLFIDSIVNGFDIPKIYMHVVDLDDAGFEFAVVDGKQRISTLLQFLDSNLALAEDFKYSGVDCEVPPKAGQLFKDLREETRDIIKEISLDVTLIRGADEDDIEELFSRLNNGEKLNAAESRNAIGGPVAKAVRDLAQEPFFKTKLKFSNRRYAHYEVSCKLLYLEKTFLEFGEDRTADLKKKYLDKFVRDGKKMPGADATKLADRVAARLKDISPIFDQNDMELSKQSYPQLMYVFATHVLGNYGGAGIKEMMKRFLVEFRLARNENLNRDEESRDSELTEFGRLMQQGTNDSGSMEKRRDILVKRFLLAHPEVVLKDTKRGFTTEERWVLWQRSDKRCASCGRPLQTLEEVDADHVKWHSQGGPTSLSNARALCVPCNRGHGGTSRELELIAP